MHSFKDKAGVLWEIEMTFGAVLRIKAATEGKVDLLDPVGGGLSQRLSDDFLSFWEVLWFLLESKAKERGVTAEQFGETMAGECLFAAQRAFFREWSDFFRHLQRPDKATALEKQEEYTAKSVEMFQAKVNAQSEAFNKTVAAAMESALNEGFGDLADTLASIQGGTPGGS